MTTGKPARKERTFFEKFGNRQIAVHGYSVDALLKHLQEHNDRYDQEHKRLERVKGNHPDEIHKRCYQLTWCSPACQAKTFNSRDTKENRQKARTRFSAAYTRLLSRYGKLLLKEYERNGQLFRAKLYIPVFPEDQTYAAQQFSAAIEKGDLSHVRLAKFAQIIGTDYVPEAPEPAQDQPPVGDQPGEQP
jgi:hypothetical protein